MKLAFTTLGCPAWDMDTIIERAAEYGYDGVDFRGYHNEMNIYTLPEFSSNIQKTARRFADAGLEVPCFSTSAQVMAFSQDPEKVKTEIKSFAEICGPFNTPFLRVFGGAIGDTPREDAINMMAENLDKMAGIIGEYGVQILLETHDAWTDSKHVAAVMEKVETAAVGVLWDTHHPFRMIDEKPEETWRNIGRWVRNTHWKDSYPAADKQHGHQLCLMGEGDVPLQEIFDVLDEGGYDGYQTLEWEKRWHPEIAEPEVAFPAFVKKMKEMAQ